MCGGDTWEGGTEGRREGGKGAGGAGGVGGGAGGFLPPAGRRGKGKGGVAIRGKKGGSGGGGYSGKLRIQHVTPRTKSGTGVRRLHPCCKRPTRLGTRRFTSGQGCGGNWRRRACRRRRRRRRGNCRAAVCGPPAATRGMVRKAAAWAEAGQGGTVGGGRGPFGVRSRRGGRLIRPDRVAAHH